MTVALITLTSAVLTYLLVRARRRHPKARHEHLWRVTSSHEAADYHGQDSKRPHRRYTRVLLACYTCPAVKVAELEGVWDRAAVDEAYRYGNLTL